MPRAKVKTFRDTVKDRLHHGGLLLTYLERFICSDWVRLVGLSSAKPGDVVEITGLVIKRKVERGKD